MRKFMDNILTFQVILFFTFFTIQILLWSLMSSINYKENFKKNNTLTNDDILLFADVIKFEKDKYKKSKYKLVFWGFIINIIFFILIFISLINNLVS